MLKIEYILYAACTFDEYLINPFCTFDRYAKSAKIC